MTEIQRQIQAIATAHEITFEQAAASSAATLTQVFKDKDVKFKYKDGSFRAMRRIDDAGLNAVLIKALSERLGYWVNC